MIGIDAQIVAMRDRWPTFKVVEQAGRRGVWEGTLDPVKRRYRVRIAYTAPFAIEMFSIIDVQPRVQVLSPKLERHAEFDEGPTPHVYASKADPTLPFLCLFDPYSGEWSPSDTIAATTVPWTARYLFFYEGWLVTGRWLGGGRHPTEKELLGDRRKSIAAL